MYKELKFWQYLNYNILYGGFINDEELTSKMREYHIGLISTSFSENPDIKNVVSTSLLTKLNDYITGCLPILHFGPSYAATDHFIKENNIGFCINSYEYPVFENSMNSMINNFTDFRCEYIKNRKTYFKTVNKICNPENVLSLLCTNS
jgi:hypothetical protein